MEGGAVRMELYKGFSGRYYVVIACRKRCYRDYRSGSSCCRQGLVIRRSAMFVLLCVYGASVCNTYVKWHGRDNEGKEYVVWCGVWVEGCGSFAGLSASISCCVFLKGMCVFWTQLVGDEALLCQLGFKCAC